MGNMIFQMPDRDIFKEAESIFAWDGEKYKLIPCLYRKPCDKMFDFANDYFMSASLMSMGEVHDCSVKPILLCCRHSVELALKALWLAKHPDKKDVKYTHSLEEFAKNLDLSNDMMRFVKIMDCRC